MSDFYDQIHSQEFPVNGIPHGSIQWNGTDVCIDLYCECGHHRHCDEEFMSYYECPKCHRKYTLGTHIKLIPLTAEQVKEAGMHRCGFKSDRLTADELIDEAVGDCPPQALESPK